MLNNYMYHVKHTQVAYETALREAKRALDEHAEKLQRNAVGADRHSTVAARVGILVGRVSSELTKECERQGAWGVVGKGTGGKLMQNGQALSRSQIIGESMCMYVLHVQAVGVSSMFFWCYILCNAIFTGTDGSVKVSAVTQDKVTGLLIPNKGSKMQLANGDVKEIPSGFFLHPQTGRVLPINGNVAYDNVASKLVFIVDSATGESSSGSSDERLVPFVPYPTNPNSGQPVKTKLKAVGRKSDLKYGAPIADPQHGLHVPIMAMTIHPETGAVLPVGGSHTDPVTGLPIAIEVGSLMVDPETTQPVPILAVAIDPQTGACVSCCKHIHTRL